MCTSYHEPIIKSKFDASLIAAFDYRRDMRKLSDISFVFLNASGGDVAQAEGLLDHFIELIFEGGAMSTWRYRILLGQIRVGL